MNKKLETQIDEALSPLLIDEGMLTSIDDCKVEVAKRAFELHLRLEDEPETITKEDVEKLVHSEGSQIGNKEPYLAHITNVGSILKDLVIKLNDRRSDLILPTPQEAYAIGLLHDISATYTDYSAGGQQSKEVDEFLLGEKHGWMTIVNDAALHTAYIGIIKLLAEGHPLPKEEFEPAYENMRKLFQGDSVLSYESIKDRFGGYLDGTDNLILMLLTVVDNTENGQSIFNEETFEVDFSERSKDIVFRYYHKPISEDKKPSLLGISLESGGKDQIMNYQIITSALLNDDKVKIDELREAGALYLK